MQTAMSISTLSLSILKLYAKKMFTKVAPLSFHITKYFQSLACAGSAGLLSRLDPCDIPDVLPGAHTSPRVS